MFLLSMYYHHDHQETNDIIDLTYIISELFYGHFGEKTNDLKTWTTRWRGNQWYKNLNKQHFYLYNCTFHFVICYSLHLYSRWWIWQSILLKCDVEKGALIMCTGLQQAETNPHHRRLWQRKCYNLQQPCTAVVLDLCWLLNEHIEISIPQCRECIDAS